MLKEQRCSKQSINGIYLDENGDELTSNESIISFVIDESNHQEKADNESDNEEESLNKSCFDNDLSLSIRTTRHQTHDHQSYFSSSLKEFINKKNSNLLPCIDYRVFKVTSSNNESDQKE